jgi:NAD(P)-dependent dehydrogenase (short-subunit alcohol dehydrogenase family)
MKTVVITGTSRGIGYETALSFARAGYQVFATMRNPKAAPELQKQCAAENLSISIMTMDVDSDESVGQCFAKIKQERSTIDVLINNAGIERHGSTEELSITDFKAVMETNYFGAIRCIQAVVPQMRENKNGYIINVTSVSGRIANTPLGAYAASKHALGAISEVLAQEVKPFNIRVAIVEPGIINTHMAQNISAGGTSKYPQVRRFGAMFEESLKQPTPPTLVANKMLEIANGKSWQVRYAVGPDAEPFLMWRASMSDEEWVDWNAQTDEDWSKAVKADFGLNVRRRNNF